MVGRHKMKAIVLARRSSGEADRVVTLFTRERGIVKAMAKGVRKIPSRRGGHLEPFTTILALLTTTRAGNFLGGVETIDHHQALQAHAPSLMVARNSILAVTGLFDEEDSQPTLFDAISHAMHILPKISDMQRNMLEIALLIHALEVAGQMPMLSRCHICGQSQPSEAVVLDPHRGAFRCLICQGGFQETEYSFPPHLLKVLRFIRMYPEKALRLKLEIAETEYLLRAIRRYMAHATEESLFTEHNAYA